jgi:AAA domain-containing protein
METDMGKVENTTANAFDWLEGFHMISELEQGDVRMLIEGIMPEGVNFIGSLAGVGKTWVALSMARALSTGTSFLDEFKVPEAVPVLYLVPEMGSRAFRKRCEKMGIPDDSMFMCRTLRDGLMRLTDERLRTAVSEIKPVIFLDSMIRFQIGDESSSSANATGLATAIFDLLRLGAPAVQCLHHGPKFSSKEFSMTLENVLRGTGDIGAMCDAVWGLEHSRCRKGKKWDREYAAESKQLTRLTMQCVKPRDFEPAEQFVIQGKPFIDEQGDFEVISQDGRSKPPSKQQQRLDTMLEMIRMDSHVSVNKVSKATGWNAGAVKNHAAMSGYKRNDDNEWVMGLPSVAGADLLQTADTEQ